MEGISKNMTYAEQFNVEPSGYINDSIANLSLSVRTVNGLYMAHIRTTEQLLNAKEEDVANVKNIGAKSLKEIRTFLSSLDSVKDVNLRQNKLQIANHIPLIFKKNKEYIASGNFSVFHDLSDDESKILLQFKESSKILDKGLIEQCCYNPSSIVPIIDMLNCFISENKQNSSYKDDLISGIEELPLTIQNATLRNVLIISGLPCDITNEEVLNSNITIKNCISAFCQITKHTAEQLKHIIRWCSFGIEEELLELFDQIYKKDNMKTVIGMRSTGHTLEEAGAVLGVTRERARQIEGKAKRIFGVWNRKYKILHQVSLLHSGDSVLTENELEEYLGDKATIIIWFLKDAKGDFIYDKELAMFICGGEELVAKGQLFLDSLPDVFHQDKLLTYLTEAEEEWDLPKEAVEKAITESYNLTGSTFHRFRLSLTSIYSEVMENHYQLGLRIYDKDELQLFREKVRQHFGDVKLPDNDRALSARLSDIGILCDRGVYKPKAKEYLPKEITDKICRYIKTSDSPVFLMNTLHSIFEDDLIPYGVDNKYFLQGILRELFEDQFVFSRDYISKNSNVTTIHSQVVKFIKESSVPVTKADIQAKFPGITDILISFAVTEPGILNYFGEYLHVDHVRISMQEREWINKLIESILSDNQAHHTQEIFDRMRYNHEEALNRNGITFQFGLYSLLQYLYGNSLQFSRPYISRKGVDIEHPAELLHDYIYNEDIILISDITAFAREIRFQIPSILDFLNTCNDSYLIVNAKEIARIDHIGIKQAAALDIENALLSCIDVAMPIQEISNLTSLPKLNVTWTEWLIYSVIKKWGTGLEVAASSNQFRMATPIISKIGRMKLDDFKDIQPSKSENVVVPDDLNDIDNLIADIIDDGLFEVDL